jgi:hypothetical protein
VLEEILNANRVSTFKLEFESDCFDCYTIATDDFQHFCHSWAFTKEVEGATSS